MSADDNPSALREIPASSVPPAETPGLIDELYREELREARTMPPAEKALVGKRRFEAALRMTLAAIGHGNPGASEDHCREILRERLALQKR